MLTFSPLNGDRGWQSPSWGHQPSSRSSVEDRDSFGAPRPLLGQPRGTQRAWHEGCSPFFPGTGVPVSIREKTSDFPSLGFPLPLLHCSHRGGLVGAARLPAGTHRSVPSAGPTHTYTSHWGAKIWRASQGPSGSASLPASCPVTSTACSCEEEGDAMVPSACRG